MNSRQILTAKAQAASACFEHVRTTAATMRAVASNERDMTAEHLMEVERAMVAVQVAIAKAMQTINTMPGAGALPTVAA